MMDDVDLYLSLRPRAKEWMPDIPGVHKLSKTDAQLDLDNILANIATQSTQSTAAPPSTASTATQQPPPASGSAEGDRTSSRKARAAQAAAAASGKPVKAEGKEAAAAHAETSDRQLTTAARPLSSPAGCITHCSLRSPSSDVCSVEESAGPSRRARLQAKINAERSAAPIPPAKPSAPLCPPFLRSLRPPPFSLSLSVSGLCWSPLT